MEKLIDYLAGIADKAPYSDNFDYENGMGPYDIAGGNFDDCYEQGVADGRIDLARELLNRFFKDE